MIAGRGHIKEQDSNILMALEVIMRSVVPYGTGR